MIKKFCNAQAPQRRKASLDPRQHAFVPMPSPAKVQVDQEPKPSDIGIPQGLGGMQPQEAQGRYEWLQSHACSPMTARAMLQSPMLLQHAFHEVRAGTELA